MVRNFCVDSPITYLDLKGRKGHKDMTPNEVSKVIVDAALKVHTALGAGMLEESYKVCLKHELRGTRYEVRGTLVRGYWYAGTGTLVRWYAGTLVRGYLVRGTRGTWYVVVRGGTLVRGYFSWNKIRDVRDISASSKTLHRQSGGGAFSRDAAETRHLELIREHQLYFY